MATMAEDRIADRSRAIEAALLNIEKRFGKGSIMRLGEREISDIPAISTTSLSLDAAIGVGGVPRGRIVEIYGPEAPGNQRSRCTLSRKHSRPEALPHTSMLSTRWMPNTRRSSASKLTTC